MSRKLGYARRLTLVSRSWAYQALLLEISVAPEGLRRSRESWIRVRRRHRGIKISRDSPQKAGSRRRLALRSMRLPSLRGGLFRKKKATLVPPACRLEENWAGGKGISGLRAKRWKLPTLQTWPYVAPTRWVRQWGPRLDGRPVTCMSLLPSLKATLR